MVVTPPLTFQGFEGPGAVLLNVVWDTETYVDLGGSRMGLSDIHAGMEHLSQGGQPDLMQALSRMLALGSHLPCTFLPAALSPLELRAVKPLVYCAALGSIYCWACTDPQILPWVSPAAPNAWILSVP